MRFTCFVFSMELPSEAFSYEDDGIIGSNEQGNMRTGRIADSDWPKTAIYSQYVE